MLPDIGIPARTIFGPKFTLDILLTINKLSKLLQNFQRDPPPGIFFLCPSLAARLPHWRPLDHELPYISWIVPPGDWNTVVWQYLVSYMRSVDGH